MLTFHPLSLDDQTRIVRFSAEEDSRSADFNFGNMFLWDGRYRQWVSDWEDRLVVLCCAYEHPVFPFPIGSGPLRPAVETMRDYARSNGFPLVIRGLEEHHRTALEALYPGSFSYTEDRDFSDYLYTAEKLAELSGRRLHGKRNHIHRFTSEHEWEFCELEPGLFPDCMALLRDWEERAGSAGSVADGEPDAIRRAFEHYAVLGLLGGILFADGQPAAFTFGERISSDTFDVHIEKANADLNGAYTMVNREFVKLIRSRYPEIVYINREDDMGLENLRKSKLSYGPDLMVIKYTAVWRDSDV